MLETHFKSLLKLFDRLIHPFRLKAGLKINAANSLNGAEAYLGKIPD